MARHLDLGYGMPFHTTLLLVDDELVLRQVMAASLRDLGFRVFEASDAEEAVDLACAAPRLDVLVTDVRLPGAVDGWELAQALLMARPTLRVLLATALAPDEFGHPLPEGTQVLRKPFSLDDLGHAVGRL